MQKIFRTDILFGISTLLIPLIALCFYPSTLDIPIHDNYFIISYIHIAIGISVLFFIFFLIYFAFLKFGRPLKRHLGTIHYFITVLTLALIFYIPTLGLSGIPRRYYTMKGDNVFSPHLDINDYVNIAAVIFLFGQVLFLINIVLTLIKPKNPS